MTRGRFSSRPPGEALTSGSSFPAKSTTSRPRGPGGRASFGELLRRWRQDLRVRADDVPMSSGGTSLSRRDSRSGCYAILQPDLALSCPDTDFSLKGGTPTRNSMTITVVCRELHISLSDDYKRFSYLSCLGCYLAIPRASRKPKPQFPPFAPRAAPPRPGDFFVRVLGG
jgi:hypothetical protein